MSELANDSQLRDACKLGDISRVASLVEHLKAETLAEKVDSKYLNSGLASAVAAGHHLVVDYLLDQGAVLRPSLVTLAMGACPSAETFEVFLRHGWDINSDTDMGWPALKYVQGPILLKLWTISSIS